MKRVPYPTLETLVWIPVEEGLWTHRDLCDGIFDAYDLMDILEFIDIREKNKDKMRAAAARAAAVMQRG